MIGERTAETKIFEVADLFCGAGGSSTGAQQAIEAIGGELDLVAINHWPVAIHTHSANHPTARHYVEDVSLVDPEFIVPNGYLDLLMASPECRYYSRARGGKPIHDQGRMNPWAVHKWLTALDVRCVLIENVPEFVEWGPLTRDFKPDRSKKGIYFQAWIRTFWDMGYAAEWRMLNAADYGDATTRIRFFLQARRDGKPILWPEPTHAKGDVGMLEGRERWRAAREIIDWTDQGRSIIDDPKYLKRPLSPKTLSRIARGLERFGGPLAPLYIQLLGMVSETLGQGKIQPFTNSDRQHTVARSMDEPVHTVTTLTGGGIYYVEPEAIRLVGANRTNNLPKGDDQPIPSPTSAGGGGSFIVEASKRSFLLSQQSGGAPRSADEPVSTVTGDGAISLTQPMITIAKGKSAAREVTKPLPTVTSQRHLGLAEPVITQYNGQSEAHSVDAPLGTITTKDRFALARPILVQTGQTGGNGPYTRPVDAPIATLTTKNDMALAQPMAVPYGPKAEARSTEEPLHTIMTKDRLALATPAADAFLVPQFGEAPGQAARVHDVNDPLPAVTSHGAGALVDPNIVLIEPVLKAVVEAGVDPRRVVLIDGVPHYLDIRFRMLRNAELARAMGFSDNETDYEFHGTVAQVTKQIGNAVPVHLAAALVKVMLE